MPQIQKGAGSFELIRLMMGRQSPQPRSTHIVICRILSAALITKLGTYALSSLVRMSFGSFEQDLSHHHLHRSQSYLS